VRLLSAYRQRLSDEAAGRSHLFADILRLLRMLWIVATLCGLAVALWLIVGELRNPYPGSGWSIIIGPVVAAMATVVGYIPYGIGQLFLSVKADNNG
jgi:hypothetical protein